MGPGDDRHRATVAVTLRAVIVDDERHARAELRTLLGAHPGIEIVGEADSVEAAAAVLAECRPDLVLLDIALGARSGFDLLDSLDHHVRIIFVTAYDSYAVRAFQVRALDYVLKPVHPDRLAEALARVESHDPTLFFKSGDSGAFVKVADIACILAEGDYSRVVTTAGREHLVLRSLADWERRLPAASFARIHRSAIANLHVVRRVSRGRDNRWRLYLPALVRPLIISRRSARRLMQFLRAAVASMTCLIPSQVRPPAPACRDAVAAIVAAFRTHDLVAVAEVHRSARDHAFLRRLVADPRLSNVAQDIVVEFGNSRYQALMDRYANGDSVPLDSLRLAWRNTTQLLVWDSPVYERFFATIRAANLTRPPGRRLRVLLADPPIDWDMTRTPADFPHSYGYRDPDWFRVIEHEVIARHHKALIVAGGAHLLRLDPRSGFRPRPLAIAGLGDALEQRYPTRSFLIATVVGVNTPLDPYLAPCHSGDLVQTAGTPLGAANAHALLPGNLTVFRIVNRTRVAVTLADSEFPPIEREVDAVLDLRGPDESVPADPSTYRDTAYVNELRRRAALLAPIFGEDLTPTIDSLARGP